MKVQKVQKDKTNVRLSKLTSSKNSNIFFIFFQVTIEVKDINDNAPSFGQDHFNIDIPENIPSGTLRKLPPAKDPDQDGVQKYEIVQGNTEEVFDLKHDKDTLDLVSYTSF